jgi:nucleoside-diphosphate-sugar epimerase
LVRVKVLLTGAAGFVGAHVARHVIAGGDDLHALVRPKHRAWRLDDVRESLQLVECDLTDPEQTEAYVARTRPDLCIHLAWYVEPGHYLDSPQNLRWVQASLTLASALAAHGCQRFVGTGTCLEYAAAARCLAEDDAVRPTSVYGACKLELSVALERLGALTGMRTAWLRLFYLFGPMEDDRRLVPSVTKMLLEDRDAGVNSGGLVRDFLHVDDAASAIWAVARSDLQGPVNIGSGRPVAVRDLVTTIGKILGKPERIVWGARPEDPAAPPYLCADLGRLIGLNTWTPRFDLETGLRNSVEWWRTRGKST